MDREIDRQIDRQTYGVYPTSNPRLNKSYGSTYFAQVLKRVLTKDFVEFVFWKIESRINWEHRAPLTQLPFVCFSLYRFSWASTRARSGSRHAFTRARDLSAGLVLKGALQLLRAMGKLTLLRYLSEF